MAGSHVLGTMKGLFTSGELITGSSPQDSLDKKQPASILGWEVVSGGKKSARHYNGHSLAPQHPME